jgi:heat shock protein HslJ
VAFILTQDGGGSGTFYYVAVALANDNGYQSLNTILLGDRIAPQTAKINEGKINVNYADRKLGESFDTEPSVGVSKYFQVIDNKLKEINITSQLTNRTWKWVDTKMNNDEIINPKKSDAFSINLKDDGSINGTTDCNNFFGKYEIFGNKLSIGALGLTLMFCDGSQENVFTKSLSEIESYFIDENNNLILQLKMDTGSMIFK